MPFLEPMSRYLTESGFGLFSFDSEGGDGQYEFDFDYAPALEMADKLTFFRLMVKQAAKEAGLVATFMPKPYTTRLGLGSPLQHEPRRRRRPARTCSATPTTSAARVGASSRTRSSPGSCATRAAIAAIATPTVNSYKRLQPRLADGTVSWAPVFAAYGDNNRSCMLRLPRNRPAVENRGVDSAANTYLAAAFMLAAGLEGIREGLDPGEPIEDITYDWRLGADRARPGCPRNLLEAIDAFDADPLTHAVFPAQFVSAYSGMKRAEWDEYHAQVTDWERERYLLAF